MKSSLSVIIPALNEGPNLEAAVLGALEGLKDRFSDYEILIFNDGSTDHTSEIAHRLSREYPHVRVIDNESNRGLAYCYREGVRQACCEYVLMVPGDNEVSPVSVASLMEKVGEADLILGYHVASHLRSFPRRCLSSLYTGTLNVVFGLNAPYFNGPTAIKKDLFSNVEMRADSFLYMAEVVIQLFQKKVPYMVSGFTFNPRSYGKSKAIRITNFLRLISDFFGLCWRLRLRKSP